MSELTLVSIFSDLHILADVLTKGSIWITQIQLSHRPLCSSLDWLGVISVYPGSCNSWFDAWCRHQLSLPLIDLFYMCKRTGDTQADQSVNRLCLYAYIIYWFINTSAPFANKYSQSGNTCFSRMTIDYTELVTREANINSISRRSCYSILSCTCHRLSVLLALCMHLNYW